MAAERRAPGVSAATDTFTCANCGETYEKTWSDEEAAAEAAGLFPGLDITDPDAAPVVCDGCFRHIMGRAQVEAPELLTPGAAPVPGMSASDVTGKALLTCVENFLVEKYGPPRLANYPAGLRLELHPKAYHKLISDPSLDWQFSAPSHDPQVELAEKFQVPVKVTSELPDSSWRLVIVTEEWLGGGFV